MNRYEAESTDEDLVAEANERNKSLGDRLMAQLSDTLMGKYKECAAALEKYGQHLPGCKKSAPTYDSYGQMRTRYVPCSCGLDSAIDAARQR